MSLQYVIDGYNLIHHPHVAAQIKRFNDPRTGLLQYITGRRLCGSLKNKLTIVFDGWPPADFVFNNTESCAVSFSRDISADERIGQLVAKAPNRKTLVVVSDDRQVQDAARSAGAQVKSVEDFLGVTAKAARQPREAPKQELSRAQMRQINTELSKLWLEQDPR